ncbi:MAG: hypothetical protein QOG79_5682, partial [Mycobacterium sp.]|nr:hypothetical protein [Mycobacterium sp.]
MASLRRRVFVAEGFRRNFREISVAVLVLAYARQMGAAAYVGRVGALAVALGIGVAIVNAAGPAVA